MENSPEDLIGRISWIVRARRMVLISRRHVDLIELSMFLPLLYKPYSSRWSPAKPLPLKCASVGSSAACSSLINSAHEELLAPLHAPARCTRPWAGRGRPADAVHRRRCRCSGWRELSESLLQQPTLCGPFTGRLGDQH